MCTVFIDLPLPSNIKGKHSHWGTNINHVQLVERCLRIHNWLLDSANLEENRVVFFSIYSKILAFNSKRLIVGCTVVQKDRERDRLPNQLVLQPKQQNRGFVNTTQNNQ